MQEDVFLRALLDRPEDLAGRLAFADWLMETGDPALVERGEFIAVQCALAGRGHGPDRRRQLEQRERDLLARHGETWAGALRPLVRRYTFRRGFVESVSVEGDTFVLRGEEVFRLAPVVDVHLATLRAGDVPALAQCPHLARVTALDVSRRNLTAAHLRALLTSPSLSKLAVLDLSRNPLGDEGARVLAGSRYLTRLTHLNLNSTGLSPAGVQALLAPGPTGRQPDTLRLTKLHLADNFRVTPEVIRGLLNSLAARLGPERSRSAARLLVPLERGLHGDQLPRALRRWSPADVTATLSRCLGHSRKAVRERAAVLLGDHGLRAAHAAGDLVRRYYEPGLRGAVAPSLQRVRPGLGARVRPWLDFLVDPDRSPDNVLSDALQGADPPLPEAVRRDFDALCLRRSRWRGRHAALSASPQTVPAVPDTDPLPAKVRGVLARAEEAAARRAPGRGVRALQDARHAARSKEAAWLLGWLLRLLQAHCG